MNQLNPKVSNQISWLVSVVLILAGLVIGVLAIRNLDKATILVSWSTASEMDTVGFNIRRANTLDGEKEVINTAVVPASDDPLIGGEYQYEDTEVESGKTYYYWLEEIETSGNTNEFGPIVETASNAAVINLILGVVMVVVGIFYAWLLKKAPRENE